MSDLFGAGGVRCRRGGFFHSNTRKLVGSIGGGLGLPSRLCVASDFRVSFSGSKAVARISTCLCKRGRGKGSGACLVSCSVSGDSGVIIRVTNCTGTSCSSSGGLSPVFAVLRGSSYGVRIAR